MTPIELARLYAGDADGTNTSPDVLTLARALLDAEARIERLVKACADADRERVAQAEETRKANAKVAALTAALSDFFAESRGEGQRVQYVEHDKPVGFHGREWNRHLAALRDALAAGLRDIAEHDCEYGDGCPVFGSRHGQCVGCKARETLAKSFHGNAQRPEITQESASEIVSPETAVAPENHGRTEEVEWRHWDWVEHATVGDCGIDVWPTAFGKWAWEMFGADSIVQKRGECATEAEAKASAIRAVRGGG
jgi:hypothetical protein